MKTTKNNEFLNSLMMNISLRDIQETELRMEVASVIYDAMKDNGITIKQLSAELNCSEDDIQLWLSGTSDIPLDVICKIEEVIGHELNMPESMYA